MNNAKVKDDPLRIYCVSQIIDQVKQKFTTMDFARTTYACYFIPWLILTSNYTFGRNIFSEDWDLAIILDACRVDALREVKEEYAFLNNIERVPSVGSSSKEWMVNTFREEYNEDISNTVYLTGNGWIYEVLKQDVSFTDWTMTQNTFVKGNSIVQKLAHRSTVNEEDFRDVIIQPLTEVGGIDGFSAEQLTDFAIKAGRDWENSRVIAHYMQPHGPYLYRAADGETPTEIDKRPIELLQQGHDTEPIRDAYLENLRYVLDNVEILLENFDGDVLITADHGEMLGNGLLSGHGEGIPHPVLKWVPWVRTTATDTETRACDIEFPEESSSSDVDKRLSALGYI